MSVKGFRCRTKRDPIESRAQAAAIASRVQKGASAEQCSLLRVVACGWLGLTD